MQDQPNPNLQGSRLLAAAWLSVFLFPPLGLILGVVIGLQDDPAIRRRGPWIFVSSLLAIGAFLLWRGQL